MHALAETQGLFRQAISGGPAAELLPLLRAPSDPVERLEIYRRHHRESFRRHLRGRYPTLEWLLGTPAMIELADALVRQHPPRAPSLAEFGEDLIDLVKARGAQHPVWLADVAQIDWHLGCVSVAIESPPLAITALAALDPMALPDAGIVLQPGLVYQEVSWPIDRLVHLRLGGAAPEQLVFEPELSCLELRGSRGRFSINRLAPADFAFRQALQKGLSLGLAAQPAFDAAPDFDLGAALAKLFADGLVVSLHLETGDHHD